ncbi:MAG: protein archease [Chloroflexi bacterium]|nr:MAG: protein archease [Chloroflexota bacterium]
MVNFEMVDHTADWAIRVWGQDLADLLRQAALGMNSLMVGQATYPEFVKKHLASKSSASNITRTLTLDAFDRETLLVDWLTELAYFAEMEQLIFPVIELTHVTPTHLNAKIQGSPVAALVKHIKAVTYHNLAISETDTGLEVTIVFDV